MGDITTLIQAAGQGSSAAVSELVSLLYPELRRIARAKLHQGAGPPGLDTTSLVHESYLRLAGLGRLQVNDRGHFLAYAARVMRSVVVDLVREAHAERRGGGAPLVTLNTELGAALGGDLVGEAQILAVHEALDELATIDARLVQVVEMRYFVGLEMDEIASALGVGKRTVERDWEKARSFLYASLRQG